MTFLYDLDKWALFLAIVKRVYPHNTMRLTCPFRTPDLVSLPWIHILTSSNGNIFSVTGLWCGELKVTGESPTQKPEIQSFGVFLICTWTSETQQRNDTMKVTNVYILLLIEMGLVGGSSINNQKLWVKTCLCTEWIKAVTPFGTYIYIYIYIYITLLLTPCRRKERGHQPLY